MSGVEIPARHAIFRQVVSPADEVFLAANIAMRQRKQRFPARNFQTGFKSQSENALWRENKFGRSAPVLGRSDVIMRKMSGKLGAIACCAFLWPRTATLRTQAFQTGSKLNPCSPNCFNHGWTRMDTDKNQSTRDNTTNHAKHTDWGGRFVSIQPFPIRVHPCPSVVELFFNCIVPAMAVLA